MSTLTEPATGPHTGSRSADLITRLREQENRAALVGYLPVGYPTVDRSIEALKTLVDHGVDLIELGVPYTDPVLDGPVIQAAAQGALDAGARVRDVFRVVRELSDYAPHVPVLVMTYWNPVLKYGPDAFARDLAAAGGAGLITPDLIPDEGADWIEASEKHGLDRVFLVAPSSTPERLRLTAGQSRGFVYAASLMGVTTGAQAAEVGRFADGVIVGSAMVRPLLSDGPLPDDEWAVRLTDLAEVTEDLAAGVRSARASAPADVPAGAKTTSGEAL